jgi:hypothetical protein
MTAEVASAKHRALAACALFFDRDVLFDRDLLQPRPSSTATFFNRDGNVAHACQRGPGERANAQCSFDKSHRPG